MNIRTALAGLALAALAPFGLVPAAAAASPQAQDSGVCVQIIDGRLATDAPSTA